MIKRILRTILPVLLVSGFTCRESVSFVPDHEISVAFYNLDNLFDDRNDTTHYDDEFTPAGKFKWTSQRYHSKLENMEKVVSQMVDGQAPDIMGACEFESKKAISDLFATGLLKDHYGIVHYDSPDERGIDVGLAYNKKKISIIESQHFVVKLSDNPRDRTRDILWVKALLKKTNDTLQLVVCHFPSRKEGKLKSEQDRIDAASKCKDILKNLCNLSTQNLVIMGDFNDEPWDKSISQYLGASDIQENQSSNLQNLMWQFRSVKKGSYFYRSHWEVLDQLMISKGLTDEKGIKYENASVHIMDQPWMIQSSGKYKGYPLRTFGGNEWLNGYSDHLPVYMKLKLN